MIVLLFKKIKTNKYNVGKNITRYGLFFSYFQIDFFLNNNIQGMKFQLIKVLFEDSGEFILTYVQKKRGQSQKQMQ